MSSMSTSKKDFESPRSPEEVHTYFRETFNAGDADALLKMFTKDAVFVPQPGTLLTTPEAIQEAVKGFLALKLPVSIQSRRIYAGPNQALLVSDWTIEG